jgi:hypothetical protein
MVDDAENLDDDDHGERIEVDGDDDNIMVGDAEGKSHGDNDDDDDDEDDDEDDSEDSESSDEGGGGGECR